MQRRGWFEDPMKSCYPASATRLRNGNENVIFINGFD